MSESALARAMRYVSILDYDELRDLSDVLRYYIQALDPDYDRLPRVPRYGRPPSTEDLFNDLSRMAQNQRDPDSLVAAFAAAMEAAPDEHALDDLRALLQMVTALVRALAPQEQRRDGRGYIETRYMPRLKFNVETGEWTVIYFGPYAYLRRWATGGGRDRKRDTLKSHYLGKDVAICYLNGTLTLDDIITAFEANALDDLKETAKEDAPTLPDPDDQPADFPLQLDPAIQAAIDERRILGGDLNKMFNETVLAALASGVIEQKDVLAAYLDGRIREFKRQLQNKLEDVSTHRNKEDVDQDAGKLRNETAHRNKTDLRIKAHHLKLLKKAAARDPERPPYVQPDSPAYEHILELVEAGLMTTFRRDGRRVYYQLTEAGTEAARRGFTSL